MRNIRALGGASLTHRDLKLLASGEETPESIDDFVTAYCNSEDCEGGRCLCLRLRQVIGEVSEAERGLLLRETAGVDGHIQTSSTCHPTEGPTVGQTISHCMQPTA